MGDMINEEEVGCLPPMSQSRHERMNEQYSSFVEDEEHWRDVRGLSKIAGRKRHEGPVCIIEKETHLDAVREACFKIGFARWQLTRR